jgi:polar amino acid transport system substrate-binding protein
MTLQAVGNSGKVVPGRDIGKVMHFAPPEPIPCHTLVRIRRNRCTPPRSRSHTVQGGDAAPSDRSSAVPFPASPQQAPRCWDRPTGSAIRTVADADRPGVRIAAVRNHASTITLSRLLKHATLVYAETPDLTFDLLRNGHADAMASVSFALERYSARLPGSRVLEDRYGANRLSMAVAKAEVGRLGYITEFIEEAKASGLVQRAIERGGLRGVHVAPAGNSQ